MMINRRTFIQRAGLAAATPAFAALVPLPHTQALPAQDRSPLPPDSPSSNSIVFKVAGWDCSDAGNSAEDEILISISQSWRAVWR